MQLGKIPWGKLKNAMGKLDSLIPDYVFDDEDGEELADSISDVWDAIANLQKHYAKYHLVKKDKEN